MDTTKTSPMQRSSRAEALLQPRAWRHAAALALAALAALTFSGCAMSTDNQSTFDPKGPVAEMQLQVFYTSVYVCVFIFSLVGTALAYSVLRFRVKDEPRREDPLPPQTQGNHKVEYGMVAVSLVLLGIIAIPTVRGLDFMQNSGFPAQESAVNVEVTGKQWWWMFKYLDANGVKSKDVVTANELVIPVGRPVVLNLESTDVIHSFWVPKLAGKLDLVPGQHNRMWLQADTTGLFYGQCTEYCGDSHANMRFRVRVVYESEYVKWLATQRTAPVQPTAGLAAEGYKLFMEGPQEGHGNACATCHNVNGTPARGLAGPDLSHFAARSSMAAGLMPRSDANIKRWLHNPDEVKPGNKMNAAKLKLSDHEVDALTAYLNTLY